MFNLDNIKVELDNKDILDFKNLSIQIDKKDKVAILGENGAGKTTLLNTILGENRLSRGKINTSLKIHDIGVVFQNNNYEDLMKVKELVKLVFPEWDTKETNSFLLKFNLIDIKNAYIRDLSNGEKQRITLGLVLTQKRKAYFFDELTSGLDALKREKLLTLMKQETQNCTVLNVTHYFEEIEKWATKILILKNGKVLFFGTSKELFKKYKIICAYKVSKKLKIPNLKYVKVNEEYIYMIKNSKEKETIEKYLQTHNTSFATLIPSIYTCYIQAYF